MQLIKINDIFMKYNIVKMLHFDINKSNFKYDLLLSLSLDENMEDTKTILFFDVANFKISEFGDGLTQLIFLQLSELDNGFDRTRYQLDELEHSMLFLTCDSFEVLE